MCGMNENLSDAKILVAITPEKTQQKLKQKWFRLSDYCDIDELLNACRTYFDTKKETEFIFLKTVNVPNSMFSETTGISKNFFELREALETLEQAQQEIFFEWCKRHNYNIFKECPYLLVSYFKEIYNFS